MEIESKFTVPDTETFDRLKELKLIGAYTLKEPDTKLVTDTYLDTADGLLRQGGLACRIRHDHARGTWLGTVKGLGGAEGDLHQREEFEVPIMPSARPRSWSRSEARDKALALAQGQPLLDIFTIRQVRYLRQVYLKQVHIAELSLDQVAIETGPDQDLSWELEIELKGQGTLDNLSALKDGLAEFNLQPEPRSKFERAYTANVSIIK
jgi:inorganic triphosphatase YgiF